jgi:hypothetical protein
MNVNEANSQITEARCEVEAANAASYSKMSYARFPGGGIALIGVDRDTAERTLPKALRCSNLFGENYRRVSLRNF